MEKRSASKLTSEGSRESTAESSNAPPRDVSPRGGALLDNEVAALAKALSAVSNEAARIVTRQHWRKCLIGTEKDQSFLVRAILKHSTPHVYLRAMEDHGEKILEVATDEFLDRAMEVRLKTIGAKELVALLAKAKRLGYDEQDVVDEEEDVTPVQNELVEDSGLDFEDIPRPAPIEPIEPVVVNRPDPLLVREFKIALDTAVAIGSPYHPSAAPASIPQNMNLPSWRKTKDPASRKFVCPDCSASFAQQGGLTYVSLYYPLNKNTKLIDE